MAQPVDIGTLQLPQLEQIKETLGDDIEQIQLGLNSLKQATHGYLMSKESLSTLTPENDGKEILVPLTNSLFVPGKIGSINKVLVDIGASYYVEQSPVEAALYFDRRVEAVKEQMDRLENTIKQKKNAQEQIILVMQQKIAQISQEQARAGGPGITGLK